MTTSVNNALQQDKLIDITTIGRKSGKSHIIEIGFHNIDGVVYISGLLGKRDWYANIVANPEFTFHLKQSAQRDIPAKAIPILDDLQRSKILPRIVGKWGRQNQIDDFMENSPLIEVVFQVQDED